MIIFALVLYGIGMIITDKLLAEAFATGMEESYEELIEETGEFIHIGLLRFHCDAIIVFGKIFIPLLWPVSWTLGIILTLRSKEEEA